MGAASGAAHPAAPDFTDSGIEDAQVVGHGALVDGLHSRRDVGDLRRLLVRVAAAEHALRAGAHVLQRIFAAGMAACAAGVFLLLPRLWHYVSVARCLALSNDDPARGAIISVLTARLACRIRGAYERPTPAEVLRVSLDGHRLPADIVGRVAAWLPPGGVDTSRLTVAECRQIKSHPANAAG